MKMPRVYQASEPAIRLTGTGYDFSNVTAAKAVLEKPDGTTALITVALSDVGLGDDADQAVVRLSSSNTDQVGRCRLQLFTEETGGSSRQVGKVVEFRVEAALLAVATVWA